MDKYMIVRCIKIEGINNNGLILNNIYSVKETNSFQYYVYENRSTKHGKNGTRSLENGHNGNAIGF
jgi:hypothetical protein